MEVVQQLDEKIESLKTCLARIEDDYYIDGINIPEGMTKEDFFQVCRVRLSSAQVKKGEIKNLVGDEKNEAYEVTLSELDSVLKRYPEYISLEQKLL